MNYKKNWEAAQQKFINWWAHKNTGRPLMIVMGQKGQRAELDPAMEYNNLEEKYTNAEKIVAHYRNWAEDIEWMGESFPSLFADFGPGSVAAYLGCDITWQERTVWFNEIMDEDDEWDDLPPLKFDPENKWFKKHIELIKKCKELSNDDFLVNIPDLMENVDVLASMRGANALIYDLVDDPDAIHERVAQVQNSYFEFYDRFYDIIKTPDGGSSYTMFSIWGPGKTAKVQCDFSAMMGPDMFREFIQEPLREQCKKLDYVLYHLDGPDAIKHVDALMEIDEIDALQWTSGDHGPDGTQVEWEEAIYDKVIRAGKSLWIKVYTGTVDDWIAGCDRLVKKYGSDRLYFYFNPMPIEDAKKLMAYAEEHWCDVKGTFQG